MVTPRKGFTKEGNLGRKILNGISYAGRNFWKVLPVANEINLSKDFREMKEAIEKEKNYRLLHLRVIGRTTLTFLYFLYGISSYEHKSLNPCDWYNNKNEVQKAIKYSNPEEEVK